jgi:hypothetical protein
LSYILSGDRLKNRHARFASDVVGAAVVSVAEAVVVGVGGSHSDVASGAFEGTTTNRSCGTSEKDME